MKRTPLKRKGPNGELRPCGVCGQLFRGQYEHRNYRQKYCSNECRAEARALPHREHWPTKDEMLRLVNDEVLSDSAIGRLYGHTYEWARRVRNHYGIPAVPKPPHREIKHGRYIDRHKWGCAQKGEDRCRVCGKRAKGKTVLSRLHLHHAIPKSMCKATSTDLRNGIPLCWPCHSGWHDRRITIFRDVFTVEEWDFLTNVKLLGQEVIPWLDTHYPDRGRPFRASV